MSTHVNYDNIRDLLLGIAANLKTKIAAIDLTQAQKDALVLIDKIITTGTGSNFLANDGAYKPIPISSMATMLDQLTTIYSLLSIATDGGGITTYNITIPAYITTKLATIVTTGTGTKLLTDNGTYQEYIPSGYRELNTTELDTLVSDIGTTLL